MMDLWLTVLLIGVLWQFFCGPCVWQVSEVSSLIVHTGYSCSVLIHCCYLWYLSPALLIGLSLEFFLLTADWYCCYLWWYLSPVLFIIPLVGNQGWAVLESLCPWCWYNQTMTFQPYSLTCWSFQIERLVASACPSGHPFLSRSSIKRTNSLTFEIIIIIIKYNMNLCLIFVYVCFVLYLCVNYLCRFDWNRVGS